MLTMWVAEIGWNELLAVDAQSGGLSEYWDFWMPKLAAILGFGLLIFVHELGHFLAAKACGVQCDRFYLGFGKAIVKRKWGETEYGIGWLPLGGYVLMLGQNDDPRKIEEETRRAKQNGVNGENKVNDENGGSEDFNPRSYLAKPVWQRAIIISAGVIMNLITAVLLGAWAYGYGVKNPAPQIGSLRAGGGAWEAGLDVGDQIDQIGDEKISDYRDLSVAATFSDTGLDETGNEKSVPVNVTRLGVTGTLQFDVVPRTFPGESRPRFGTTSSQTVTLAPLPLPEYFPESIRTLYAQFGGRTIESIDVLSTADGKDGENGETAVVETRNIANHAELSRLCARYPDKALRLRMTPMTENTTENTAKNTVGTAGKNTENTSETTGNTTGNTVVVPAIPLLLPAGCEPTDGEDVFCRVGAIERIRRGSVAEKAGLRIGDQITMIDGEPVGDALLFAESLRRRAFSETPTVKLTVERNVTQNTENEKNGETAKNKATVELEVTLEAVERFDSPTPWTGDPSVNPGDPFSAPSLGIAYRGVLPEDLESATFVLPESVPGMDAVAWAEVRSQLEASLNPFRFDEAMSWACFVQMCQESLPPGTQVALQRAQESTPVTLVPSATLYRVDHGLQCTALTKLVQADGVVAALRCGVDETAFGAGLVFRVLGNLNKVKKDIGGPIAIFKGANDTAAAGLVPYLLFLVAISANLAVLNILPIPALDGGHLVFLLWEGVTGRRPNERIQMILTMIGIALLLTLMTWAIGLDLLRLFHLL